MAAQTYDPTQDLKKQMRLLDAIQQKAKQNPCSDWHKKMTLWQNQLGFINTQLARSRGVINEDNLILQVGFILEILSEISNMHSSNNQTTILPPRLKKNFRLQIDGYINRIKNRSGLLFCDMLTSEDINWIKDQFGERPSDPKQTNDFNALYSAVQLQPDQPNQKKAYTIINSDTLKRLLQMVPEDKKTQMPTNLSQRLRKRPANYIF